MAYGVKATAHTRQTTGFNGSKVTPRSVEKHHLDHPLTLRHVAGAHHGTRVRTPYLGPALMSDEWMAAVAVAAVVNGGRRWRIAADSGRRWQTVAGLVRGLC